MAHNGNDKVKDEVIHSGVLTRRCGPKKGKAWQERFFTLCQSATTRAYYLCYYRTSDPKQPRDVKSCYMTLASPDEPSLLTTLYRFDRGMYQRPGHVFALHPGVSAHAHSHRTYLFEVKTQIERDQWIAALLRHGCQDGGLILPALQDTNALHESWLWVKQSGVLHGWKWRLVALRWNEIRYYKLHDGKTRLNGQIMLSERSIIKTESSKKHSFSFQSNSLAKPILFSCHDDDERSRWMTALKRVCDSTISPQDKRDRESITSCFMDTPMSVQHVDSHSAHEQSYLPVLIPTTSTVVDFGVPRLLTASTASTLLDPPSESRSSRPSMSSTTPSISRVGDESCESSVVRPGGMYSTQVLDAVMLERERELAEREGRTPSECSPRDSNVGTPIGSTPLSTSACTSANTSPRSPGSAHRRDISSQGMSEKTAKLMNQLSYVPPAREHSPSTYQSQSRTSAGSTTARRPEQPIVANARPQLTPAVRLLPNPFEINQVAATAEHRERVLSRMPTTDRMRNCTVSGYSSPSSPTTLSPSSSYSRFMSPATSPTGSTRQFTMSNLGISSVNLTAAGDATPTQSATARPPRAQHERSQTALVQSARTHSPLFIE